MRVRFTETVQYESEGRGRGPIYEAGSEHDFAPAFAERWLRRKVAEVVAAPVAAEPVVATKAVEMPAVRVVENVPTDTVTVKVEEAPRRRGRPPVRGR